MRLTTLIKGGKSDAYLSGNIVSSGFNTLTLSKAYIYWKYQNIIAGVNDTIRYGNTDIVFGQGYWTFDMIRQVLRDKDIDLVENVQNNTCSIKPKTDDLDLKMFAPLIGFPETEILTGGEWEQSDAVEINQGLLYVNIGCNLINTYENFGPTGAHSVTLATLPVTSEQPLNSTMSRYMNVNSHVKINSGVFNMIHFDVTTNITKPVDMDVLLELYID